MPNGIATNLQRCQFPKCHVLIVKNRYCEIKHLSKLQVNKVVIACDRTRKDAHFIQMSIKLGCGVNIILWTLWIWTQSGNTPQSLWVTKSKHFYLSVIYQDIRNMKVWKNNTSDSKPLFNKQEWRKNLKAVHLIIQWVVKSVVYSDANLEI